MFYRDGDDDDDDYNDYMMFEEESQFTMLWPFVEKL